MTVYNGFESEKDNYLEMGADLTYLNVGFVAFDIEGGYDNSGSVNLSIEKARALANDILKRTADWA